MFWELYQQTQHEKSDSEGNPQNEQKQPVESEFRRLYDRVDSLALICQAMWELIREKTDLTDREIEQKIEEIDLRDGKADGKMTTETRRCAQCGKIVARRHAHCLYCGAELGTEHIFE